jgi:RND family efflux transporter MFP subunit
MFRKKSFWIALLVIILVAAGGGGYYYNNIYLLAQEPPEPTIKTVKVRRGDLVITASGAGTLVPVSEVGLGFRSSGLLTEVTVGVGDEVEAGDLLARMDDTEARKAVTAAELQVAQAEATLASQQDPTAAQRVVTLAELQVAQAEATLASQQDPTAAQRAMALAEIQVAQAEANLETAQLKLDELLDWAPDETAVKLAQATLDAAQADYQEVVARSGLKDDQLTVARVNLERAEADLAAAQEAYNTAWDQARDWELDVRTRATALENERASTERNLEKAQADLEIAQANYNLAVTGINDSDLLNAWTKVLNAQATLQNAQTGPNEADVEAARIQVGQAELALAQAQLNLEAAQDTDTTQAELALTQAQINLEAAQLAAEETDTTQAEIALAQAQLNLEAAQRTLEQTALTTPVDGTVVAVAAQPGETVGTAPLVTVADLSWPVVEIYLDETDLDKIAAGYQVRVVFDALPDETFSGHVAQVDPMLVTVDGVPAVQGRATLDEESFAQLQALPLGLNAAVEVIAGRAEDALLVPVEALRELAPGQYAVFVMEDGKPKMRVVEVGLMDYTSAEIVSGLEAGDVVSTGVVETE